MKASTMCRIALLGFIVCVLTTPLFAADKYTFNPTQIEHGIVIADTTGKWSYMWPINQGLWSWASEIVVHLTRREWLGKDINSGHEVKPDTSGITMQARSTDNGDTWTIEGEFRPAGPAKKPINFTSPWFAMKAVGGNFFVTYDKAKTWIGPYEDFREYSIEMRPDKVFTKDNGKTAITVITRRPPRPGGGMIKWQFGPASMLTTDGGLTWSVRGQWPDNTHKAPDGKTDYIKQIQSATVRLGENEFLSVGRSRYAGALYRSTDFGESWEFEGVVDDRFRGPWVPSGLVVLGGEYPDNTETDDIVVVWGSRGNMEIDGDTLKGGPRARYSNDGGKTWSDNTVQLRNDVSKNQWDTGYIVTTQRTDGKILAIYYWQTDRLNQPHIACTVFDPNVEGAPPINTSNHGSNRSRRRSTADDGTG